MVYGDTIYFNTRFFVPGSFIILQHDSYFERMTLMREQDIPKRVKFMIDEVIELRSHR